MGGILGGPKPPDPKKTAAAQTGTNVSTAVANAFLNNTTQKTPYGSKRYDVSGYHNFKDPNTGKTYKIPTFTEVTNLNKHGQKLKQLTSDTELNLGNIARDMSGGIRDHLSKPMDFSGLPNVSRGGKTRRRVENALMSRLRPELSESREALRTQLSEQGIKLGSEAYMRGMREHGQNANDARMSAILAAGQEASRVHGMDMANRNQSIQERLLQRNQPINEIGALTSGSQVSMPQFGATPQNGIPTTDYAGLVQDNFRARQARHNATVGGLFGLGSSLITGFG